MDRTCPTCHTFCSPDHMIRLGENWYCSSCVGDLLATNQRLRDLALRLDTLEEDFMEHDNDDTKHLS